MAVLMAQSCESGSQKIIHIANKIKDNLLAQFWFEPLFFCRIGGVEHKVVNVYPDEDWLACTGRGRYVGVHVCGFCAGIVAG